MRAIVRFLLTVLGVVLCTSAVADDLYRVVDLGQLRIPGATDYTIYTLTRIYDNKQILGVAWDIVSDAFLWQPGTRYTILESITGSEGSYAGGISPTGKIVGTIFFSSGTPYSLACTWDTAGHVSLLGPAPTYLSAAYDIAADGTIIGEFDYYPALWAPDGSLSYLPVPDGYIGGSAVRMNKLGDIIGYTYDQTTGQQVALFWDQAHNPTLIGAPAGGWSIPNDINDHGWVVGTLSTNFYGPVYGFRWNLKTGMKQLPGFPDTPLTYASGINNKMQTVGSSILPIYGFTAAVLWENGQAKDLNKLIGPYAGWFLTTADAINDRGEIGGFANRFLNGRFTYHAYLLEPERR